MLSVEEIFASFGDVLGGLGLGSSDTPPKKPV